MSPKVRLRITLLVLCIIIKRFVFFILSLFLLSGNVDCASWDDFLGSYASWTLNTFYYEIQIIFVSSSLFFREILGILDPNFLSCRGILGMLDLD